MEEKDLVSKIVRLKSVKPNDEWVVSCRSRLAFRMEMGRKKALLNKDVFVLREIFSFWNEYNQNRTIKAAYALVIVFALIVSGSGLTVLAAMKSLPGSHLYRIKLAAEKTRLMIATSGENKVQLQSEMTNRRLAELKEVVAAPESLEQKKNNVEQVVGQIQQQLSDFKDQLPKPNGNEPQKIVATAKILNEKASQVGKALTEAGNVLSGETGQNLSDKINEVTEIADKTGLEALEIIIKQDKLDEAGQKDLAVKIEEIINSTKEKLKSIEAKLIALEAIKANSNVRAVLIKDQSDKAQDLLEQAETALKQGEGLVALENIKAAKEIIKSTEKIVEMSSTDSGGVKTNESNQNKAAASSTTIQK